jgi:hypothetical protein
MARVFVHTNPDYLDCGASVTYPTTALTVTGWCWQPSSGANVFNTYFGLTNGGHGGSGAGIQFALNANCALAPLIGCTGGNVSFSGANHSKDTWHMFGISYDTTNGAVGYTDGSADGTDIAKGSPTALSSPSCHIGENPDINGRGYEGRIGDIALWTAALTAAEHKALSQGARPYQIRSGSLKGWWPIDGMQSPEPDLSGFKNNGTLNGTPTLVTGPPFMMFTPRWPMGGILPFTAPSVVQSPAQVAAHFVRRVNVVGY